MDLFPKKEKEKKKEEDCACTGMWGNGGKVTCPRYFLCMQHNAAATSSWESEISTSSWLCSDPIFVIVAHCQSDQERLHLNGYIINQICITILSQLFPRHCLIKRYRILHPIDLPLILKLISNRKRHNNDCMVRARAQP